MTNEEMEDKLKRVAEIHVVQAEILDRVDRKLEGLADSHVVQAELLDRPDRKLGQLAEASGDDHRTLDQLLSATDHLLRVTESHNQQLLQLAEMIHSHEARLVGVGDQTALMLSALNSLFQRMDAFIQGLQKGDGHSGGAR